MLSMAKGQAHWSDVDMVALIEYLTSQLPTIADSVYKSGEVWLLDLDGPQLQLQLVATAPSHP